MQSTNEWYCINNSAVVDSPALIVFPDRVQQNIQTAIDMVGQPERLRPHVKTHKCPEVVQLMMDAGIDRFKCATIAEAEMLAMKHAPDVLLAYQPTGPKLERFAALITKYPDTSFACLVDNKVNALEQSTLFYSKGWKVRVFLDLNIGMNRTGIAAGADAIALYTYCANLDGVEPIGLHAYDGHIRDIDLHQREAACDAAIAPVLSMKSELVAQGHTTPVIIAGGSHSFPVYCKQENIECSPGTFVYWDKSNSEWCPEQNFLPAALVMSRVVSLPGEGLVCVDLGHKSIAAENELTRRVYFLNAGELEAVSQSEEHLVLKAGKDHRYMPGDILYGIPIHVCPTVALYEKSIVVMGGEANGEWSTIARNRKITV